MVNVWRAIIRTVQGVVAFNVEGVAVVAVELALLVAA